MVHEFGEGAFDWNGLHIDTVRISDEYIRADIPMHRHAADSFELHVILSGRGKVKSAAGECAVQAGDFFITLGEAEHEQGSDARDPVRELCVYAAFGAGKRPYGTARAFLAQPFFMGRADEDMLLAARQTAKELSLRREGFEDALRSYFRLMLISAARSRAAGGEEKRALSAGGALFLRIEEAFLYEYRSVTLSSLAESVGLSARQLQRVLRERYGQTFIQKRTEARMRAAQLLLEGDLPVSRIAEETGYACVEHFCAEYKKYSGMTAGAYRRRCKTFRRAH